MNTYISLLRGINISGQKLIKMAELREVYTKIGFNNVSSYIASGNLAFQYQKESHEKLQELILKAIKNHYGWDVPNLILNHEQVKAALDKNPYKEIEKVYFTFLSDKPTQENIDKLFSYKFEDEYYQLIDKVIYSHTPKGPARAKFNNNFIENKLKVMATTRNLNTTNKLLEMSK